jgi:hypothetical protein
MQITGILFLSTRRSEMLAKLGKAWKGWWIKQ